MDTNMLYFNQKQVNKQLSKGENNMKDLELIKHIYSAELDLSRETILTINTLALIFNLDNIFTVNDTKQDVLDKLSELHPNKNF